MIFIKHLFPALQFPPIRKTTRVRVEITITKGMWYDLGSYEQKDFIKITGLSSRWLSNHKDAGLLGARYDVGNKSWDFVPYYHFNGERRDGWTIVGNYAGHFRPESIVSAKIGDKVVYDLDLRNGYWHCTVFKNGQLRIIETVATSSIFVKAWRVLGWGGGSTVINRTFVFCMKFLNK